MTYKEALKWLDAVINKPEVCGGNQQENNEALQVLKKAVEKAEDYDYLTNSPYYKENGRKRAGLIRSIKNAFYWIHYLSYMQNGECEWKEEEVLRVASNLNCRVVMWALDNYEEIVKRYKDEN